MRELHLIRHGQASYLSGNYDQLSTRGIEQAHHLGHYLLQNEIQFDEVYSGPLERQKHTCNIVKEIYIKADRFFPEPIIMESLVEHDGPKALGLIYDHLVANDLFVKQLQDQIIQSPEVKFEKSLEIFEYFIPKWMKGEYDIEGVQSWEHFRLLANKGIQSKFSKLTTSNSIAAFTSGGTITAILADVLKIDDHSAIAQYMFRMYNTAINSFYYDGTQLNLHLYNNTTHLHKDMITIV